MNGLSWMLRVGKRFILSFLACLLISLVFLGSGNAVADNTDTTSNGHIYFTNGVHNNYECNDSNNNCISPREPSAPSDPQYPQWWISDWTMYRVFQNYDKFPPPYDSPPLGLTPNDYEVSYGKTYYDSTYIPEDGDGTGAMMEYYEKRCLPIFPQDNKFTCSFVSLGNKAYFLSYDDEDPKKKPSICLFSPQNHPPRTDFIKHLPYNPVDSAHLNNSLQAYSQRFPRFERDEQGILFGYAFEKNWWILDSVDHAAEHYHRPQSFYFSGDPDIPPDAPIVSQNYTRFRIKKPTPETWSRIAEMLPPNPESCCLFQGDCHKNSSSQTSQSASWDALKYSAPQTQTNPR